MECETDPRRRELLERIIRMTRKLLREAAMCTDEWCKEVLQIAGALDELDRLDAEKK